MFMPKAPIALHTWEYQVVYFFTSFQEVKSIKSAEHFFKKDPIALKQQSNKGLCLIMVIYLFIFLNFCKSTVQILK